MIELRSTMACAQDLLAIYFKQLQFANYLLQTVSLPISQISQ